MCLVNTTCLTRIFNLKLALFEARICRTLNNHYLMRNIIYPHLISTNNVFADLNRDNLPDLIFHFWSGQNSENAGAVVSECPKEIIDQIGGWSSSDVGESYGDGFPLINLHEWCSKINLA